MDSSRPRPALYLASNFMMGITTSDTREGDLICRFWNTTVATVLRPFNTTNQFGAADCQFKVIGRANVAALSKWNHEASNTDYVVNLYLDIETIQALSWDD